jgi:hypothetical protein
MGYHMKILAKKGIMPYAKSNANVPRFSSADPSSKAPLSPAETYRKNGSTEVVPYRVASTFFTK